jgi:hypothetical protein
LRVEGSSHTRELALTRDHVAGEASVRDAINVPFGRHQTLPLRNHLLQESVFVKEKEGEAEGKRKRGKGTKREREGKKRRGRESLGLKFGFGIRILGSGAPATLRSGEKSPPLFATTCFRDGQMMIICCLI